MTMTVYCKWPNQEGAAHHCRCIQRDTAHTCGWLGAPSWLGLVGHLVRELLNKLSHVGLKPDMAVWGERGHAWSMPAGVVWSVLRVRAFFCVLESKCIMRVLVSSHKHSKLTRHASRHPARSYNVQRCKLLLVIQIHSIPAWLMRPGSG